MQPSPSRMLIVAVVADALLSCLYVVDQDTGCFALIRFIFRGPIITPVCNILGILCTFYPEWRDCHCATCTKARYGACWKNTDAPCSFQRELHGNFVVVWNRKFRTFLECYKIDEKNISSMLLIRCCFLLESFIFIYPLRL